MALLIQPLEKSHLPEARRIFRLAFGTFLGVTEPERFAPGVDFYGWRRELWPEGAWGAFEGDRLVGSVITSRWGSMGFFGPLTIDPGYWDQGIAQRLLVPVMDCFDRWETRLDGLFTFSSSPKHLALYQKYGFFPGHLVGIMQKAIEPGSSETLQEFRSFSRIEADRQSSALESCRQLTDSIFPGLDLTAEIRNVADNKLGETIVLGDENEVDGFAICHLGTGTEAGTSGAYVKFGAVRPGPEAAEKFARLIQAAEAFARMRGSPQLFMGVNTARKQAYQGFLDQGFRIGMLGVAMHRGKHGHYHGDSDFVIEDLR